MHLPAKANSLSVQTFMNQAKAQTICKRLINSKCTLSFQGYKSDLARGEASVSILGETKSSHGSTICDLQFAN